MNEREIDNELLAKYLQFLIDSAKNLLADGLTDYAFEDLMREYARFLMRIRKSLRVADTLKKELFDQDFFTENDLSLLDNSIVEGFLYKFPFGKQLLSLNNKVKMEKVLTMYEKLSHILFSLNAYRF